MPGEEAQIRNWDQLAAEVTKDIRDVAELAALEMISEKPASPDKLPAIASLISRAGLVVKLLSELRTSPFGGNIPHHTEPMDIKDLLDELDSNKKEPLKLVPTPRKQVVHGVFFGCHLLYQGWWTRKPGEVDFTSGDWTGGGPESFSDIRHWRNYGYEQWGPSWDLWDPGIKDQCLFGQIGPAERDESNSLHVVVAPKAARQLRKRMKGKLAVSVIAQGTLCHNDHSGLHINRNMQAAVDRQEEDGFESMSWYFLINDFESDGSESLDFIQIDTAQPIVYSAYIWLCLIRQSDREYGISGRITLPKTLFIWSHTNILNANCVRFDYECLMFQKKLLEDQLGEKLIILARSYTVDDILRTRLEPPLIGQRHLSRLLFATNSAVVRSG